MTDSMLAEITAVEQQKKNRHRYNIYLDGCMAFSIHEDVMIKHRVLKGEMMDREWMETVLREEELHQAGSRVIRLLGRRARSEQEIRQYLEEKGYEAELIQEVIHKLKQDQYLDDAQFAQWMASQRIISQKKGRLWVRQELSQKGISKDHIQAALEQLDKGQELAGAVQLAKKKWNLLLGAEPEMRRHKVMAYLLRRGYSLGLVREVLAQIKLAEPEERD